MVGGRFCVFWCSSMVSMVSIEGVVVVKLLVVARRCCWFRLVLVMKMVVVSAITYVYRSSFFCRPKNRLGGMDDCSIFCCDSERIAKAMTLSCCCQ